MAARAPSLGKVVKERGDASSERLRLDAAGDDVFCRLHPAEGEAAILWVFGAGGGIGGPADGVYLRLARKLQPLGVASLELDYRRPGDFAACVGDALLGVAFLESEGKRRIALVGHSFGGAVVIAAGALSGAVVAVAALSSQTAGTDLAARLSPKPLLLVHGGADDILPASCSRSIYARAGEPKQLIIYPECRHGLDQCREDLDRDLSLWLETALLRGDVAGKA